MAELGVLRIGHIEAVGHQIVHQLFGETMDGQRVGLAGKRSLRFLAANDGEGRHSGKEKCFQVIAADHDYRVGLDFVQILAQLAHRGDVGIQLRFVFARRIGE